MAKELFAKRLVELREKNNVSQAELAEHLGVTRQSLSLYETGERTINIDLLEKIARYFNVSADYLLGISNAHSVDLDTQAICKRIGCSEEALNGIIELYDIMPFGASKPFLDAVFSTRFEEECSMPDIMLTLFCHVGKLIEAKAIANPLMKAVEGCTEDEQLEKFSGIYKETVFKFRAISDEKDAFEWRLMKAVSNFSKNLAAYIDESGLIENMDGGWVLWEQ